VLDVRVAYHTPSLFKITILLRHPKLHLKKKYVAIVKGCIRVLIWGSFEDRNPRSQTLATGMKSIAGCALVKGSVERGLRL
jgi:hypothetical protein